MNPETIQPPPVEIRELGATIVDDGVRFRVWSTRAERVAVVLYDKPGDGGEPQIAHEHPLEARGDGLFAATLELTEGALYKFRVNDDLYPDPYARVLPYGVHGPAEVMRPGTGKPIKRERPALSECVIYELHIGTFTPEGTYAAAMKRLPALAELGVTAIELLPLSSFSGRWGWGYDGVAHFAPHAAYGRPEDLRALVDAAHGLGLAVIFDVVYNHFGPEGNYLGAYSPEYFTDAVKTPWGAALDYATSAMRRFVIENAMYWLTEFDGDGLRLDATHTIHDVSDRKILAELVDAVRGLDDPRILIAEDETNDPQLIVGTGLDAVWADDFHHIVHVLSTGERDGYYDEYEPSLAQLARCIDRGFFYEGQPWRPTGHPRGAPADAMPAPAFVYCLQNHDQVGNRALGERLHHIAPRDLYCAMTALLLFLPTTPMLWMGQEWGASTPWQFFTDHPEELGKLVTEGRRGEFKAFAAFADPNTRAKIPDPQAESTYRNSQLRWEEREQSPHRELLALHRALLQLRRDDAVLRVPDRHRTSVGTDGLRSLWVRRWTDAGQRLLVIDLGERPDLAPPAAVHGPNWKLLLHAGAESIPGLPAARAAIYAAEATS
ncbi:MAG TPA: malto-oligosyltrehalose trehalohydrolase [Nannocystis sp.]